MKLVPGYTFKVAKKARENFHVGSTYRIYHIAPLKEGVEYIFQSTDGNVKEIFKSCEYAEAVINKISGK